MLKKRRNKCNDYMIQNNLSIIEFCEMAEIKVLDFIDFMEGAEFSEDINEMAEKIANVLGISAEEVLEYDVERPSNGEYYNNDRRFFLGNLKLCNGKNGTYTYPNVPKEQNKTIIH